MTESVIEPDCISEVFVYDLQVHFGDQPFGAKDSKRASGGAAVRGADSSHICHTTTVDPHGCVSIHSYQEGLEKFWCPDDLPRMAKR